MEKQSPLIIIIVGIIVLITLFFVFTAFTGVNLFDFSEQKKADAGQKDLNEVQGQEKEVIVNEKETEVDNMAEIVVLETSMGNIEIELNRKKAPATVENFVKYVNEGHYDGVIFHRVIKGFMIQTGNFLPSGKQKETRDPIKIESSNGLKNLKGTIAMARTNEPDSATDQFFINAVDNAFLDYQSEASPGYAVFGKTISGMDIVSKIENVATSIKGGYSDWPDENILIKKAYMKK